MLPLGAIDNRRSLLGLANLLDALDAAIETPALHGVHFIADAESGVPISITVKRKGTEEFVRDAKDPRQVNEPELAPTAWVTQPMELEISVWSLTELPADFELKVYDWTTSQSSADAAPGAPPQSP